MSPSHCRGGVGNVGAGRSASPCPTRIRAASTHEPQFAFEAPVEDRRSGSEKHLVHGSVVGMLPPVAGARPPLPGVGGGDGASAPTTTPSLGCGGPLERPLAQTTLWPPQPPVTPRRTTPRPRSPAPHLSSRTPRATRRHRLCGRWRSGLVRRPPAGPAAFHADSREQPRLGSIGHPARHPAGRHVLDTDTPHRPDDRGRRLFGGVPPDRSHSGMDPGEARHRPTPDYGARHVAALVLIVEPGLSP